MARYFLQVAYKGTPYHGWQIQPREDTVQGRIEAAFFQIWGPVKIIGSSRTDTGVHARAQVAHVDLPDAIDKKKLCYQLNAVLPTTISIDDIIKKSAQAHARYDAISRSYEYHIATSRDPFSLDTSYALSLKLDLKRMNQVAISFLGKQDFASFCKKKSMVAHHYCDVQKAIWRKHSHKYVFYITANRFLHGMVRTIAGVLVEVGTYKVEPEEVQNIFLAKDRCYAGKGLPAHGLCLTNIAYPPMV